MVKIYYFWKIVRGEDKKGLDTEIDMKLKWAIKYDPELGKY